MEAEVGIMYLDLNGAFKRLVHSGKSLQIRNTFLTSSGAQYPDKLFPVTFEFF